MKLASPDQRSLKSPIGELAKKIKKGRGNMISLGLIAEIIGLSDDDLQTVLQKQLGKKGEQALQSSLQSVTAGREAASTLDKFLITR